MTPLRVVATLAGPVALPYHPLALDALLAYAVCERDEIPPAMLASQIQPIEIPVEREPQRRFHLASVGAYQLDQSELRYVHKRAPIEQYQSIGSDKIKRVQITAGPNKSYRIPLEVKHVVDDQITWWCIGDAEPIRELLAMVTHLGKRRAVGVGRVASWVVDDMPETWPGFPVVSGDGAPLRTLPPDWPGLRDPRTALGVLTYPYWDQSREALCAVP